MSNINVNRNVTDVFYRYKMPRLIAKVEGKGNGIKTVIVNMSEIAKSLCRPPTYPTKYFGCELGAQTQFDSAHDRFIVNGAHDAAKLQDLLDGFIKRFVLCPECENPETKLTVLQKKQMIQQHCIACGHQHIVDMRHKLTTFILKNPDNLDSGIGADSMVKKEKGSTKVSTTTQKSGKKSKKEGAENGNDVDSGIGDGGKKHKGGKQAADDDNSDVDNWGEDTSDEAVKARLQNLSIAAKTMTHCDDLDKSQQERVDMFYSFVKQRKEAGGLNGGDREKELVAEAERLDIKDQAPLVLAELLFDANMVQQLKQHRSLLSRFTNKNVKAQQYMLGGFEQLVGCVHKEALMPKVPIILKTFYEHDILDEEVIIDWGKKASKKYISKEVLKEVLDKAEPFLKWLEEAEEESSAEEGQPDQDEDDDDDIEVVYSESPLPKQNGSAMKPAEEDFDLNIDDI